MNFWNKQESADTQAVWMKEIAIPLATFTSGPQRLQIIADGKSYICIRQLGGGAYRLYVIPEELAPFVAGLPPL